MYDNHQPVTTTNYPAPRKSRRVPVIIGVVIAAMVALCSVGVIAVAILPAGEAPLAIDAPQVTPDPLIGGVPDRGTAPAPNTKVYGVKDFEPSLKITDKDCIDFGTIPDSCTYQYEVRLAIADPAAYKRAGDSYSVTYSVRGLSGGEQIGTVEVDGDGGFTQWPGFGQAGPKAKLSVRVTDVERRP